MRGGGVSPRPSPPMGTQVSKLGMGGAGGACVVSVHPGAPGMAFPRVLWTGLHHGKLCRAALRHAVLRQAVLGRVAP